MSNPSVLMLKELLRSVEAGEVTIVDCNLSSETEETTAEMDAGPVDTSTKLTGKVDWWFTTQPGDKALKLSFDKVALDNGLASSEKLRARFPSGTPEWRNGSTLTNAQVAQSRIDWAHQMLDGFTAGKLTVATFLQLGDQQIQCLTASLREPGINDELYVKLQGVKARLRRAMDTAAVDGASE